MTVQGHAQSGQAGLLALSLAPLIRTDMKGSNA